MAAGQSWLIQVGAAMLMSAAACGGNGPNPDASPGDAPGTDGPPAVMDSGPCPTSTCDGPPSALPDATASDGRQPPAEDGRGTADRSDTGGGTAPDAARTDGGTACSACQTYGEPELLGRVEAPSLGAISGMAASWRNPGVLYVHNDRNALEFFAVSERGMVLGHFTLTGPGATGRDLEDMEVARCPAGTCVYLADVGNNIAPMRSEFVIFRAPEPEVSPARPTSGPTPLSFERFAFTYPDGASNHNAESLLVDPGTGAVYVIDKRAAGQPSAVYRLPSLDPARPAMAVKVADLPVPMAGDQPATAASAHPCGAGFLLRTTNALYEFRIATGTSFEQAFRVAPARVPVAVEAQGEAVAYAPNGTGYYTTSERPSGPAAPINRVVCR